MRVMPARAHIVSIIVHHPAYVRGRDCRTSEWRGLGNRLSRMEIGHRIAPRDMAFARWTHGAMRGSNPGRE